MTAQQIIEKIKPLGSESYKKILLNHGAKEPCLGVKIGDLKKIQKRLKKDYQVALDLYDTGIYDAMYLAGMIADPARMTRKDLQRWAERAYGAALGAAVSSVAARNPEGYELALEWIDSNKESVATVGWLTLSTLLSLKDGGELDVPTLKRFLQRVQKTIHKAPNDVRYVMNSFVIAVGSYVPALTEVAVEVGEKIGRVEVDMGNTACEVPFAPEYIRKVQKRGTIGKKRKSAK
jgi:3-methyladenine DNA glycosylase AlkD